MQRISAPKGLMEGRLTRSTVWGTRLLLGFGIVCVIGAVGLSFITGQIEFEAFLPLVFLLIIYQWRRTFSDIVDEVQDTGNGLLLKRNGRSEHVPLSAVDRAAFEWRTLSGSSRQVLPVVRLTFRERRKFGDEAVFIADTSGSGISAESQEASGQRLAETIQHRAEQADH